MTTAAASGPNAISHRAGSRPDHAPAKCDISSRSPPRFLPRKARCWVSANYGIVEIGCFWLLISCQNALWRHPFRSSDRLCSPANTAPRPPFRRCRVGALQSIRVFRPYGVASASNRCRKTGDTSPSFQPRGLRIEQGAQYAGLSPFFIEEPNSCR